MLLLMRGRAIELMLYIRITSVVCVCVDYSPLLALYALNFIITEREAMLNCNRVPTYCSAANWR